MTEGNKKGNISRAALLAAAGVAAGYYFYASKHAKTHRKAAAKWANDLKDEVVAEAKKLKAPDKETLAAIVDTAASTYAKARNIDSKQIAKAAQELKTHWEKIVKEVKTQSGVLAKKARASKKRSR